MKGSLTYFFILSFIEKLKARKNKKSQVLKIGMLRSMKYNTVIFKKHQSYDGRAT